VDDSAKPRSFLLDRGKLIRIDVPGAMLTVANGINERGQVVGFYVDAGGMPHGYLWEKGRFATVDAPGPMPTAAIDINDRGQILGAYGPITGEVLHGFLMSGRVYTTFDAPGVALTQPSAINNRGQIVGLTLDAPGADSPGTRGFLLAQGVKGPFAPVAFPGAARTAAFDINDRGRIVETDGQTGAPTEPHADAADDAGPLMMPVR
jgi:probable HAF family extracellular repeat protein